MVALRLARAEALRINSDFWNASVGNGEANLQIMKGIHVISYRDRILMSYIIPKEFHVSLMTESLSILPSNYSVIIYLLFLFMVIIFGIRRWTKLKTKLRAMIGML